jgi:hypothetical protein
LIESVLGLIAIARPCLETPAELPHSTTAIGLMSAMESVPGLMRHAVRKTGCS